MVRTGMTGMVGTRIGGMFIQEYAVMLFWLNCYISKAFKYIFLYLFIVIVRPAGLELLCYIIEF